MEENRRGVAYPFVSRHHTANLRLSTIPRSRSFAIGSRRLFNALTGHSQSRDDIQVRRILRTSEPVGLRVVWRLLTGMRRHRAPSYFPHVSVFGIFALQRTFWPWPPL